MAALGSSAATAVSSASLQASSISSYSSFLGNFCVFQISSAPSAYGITVKSKILTSIVASSENYSLAATFQSELIELKNKDERHDKNSNHSTFQEPSRDELSEFSDSVQGHHLLKGNSDTEMSSRPFYGNGGSSKFVGLKNERPPPPSPSPSPSSLIHLSRGEWEDRAYKLLQQRRMRKLKAEKEANSDARSSNSTLEENVSMPPERSSAKLEPNSSKFDSNLAKFVSDMDVTKNKHSASVNKLKLRNKLLNKEGKFSPSHRNSFTHLQSDQSKKVDYELLSRDLGRKGRWMPLIDYLICQGFTQSDFERIINRHKSCLLLNVSVVKKRVDFLKSLGVNQSDVPKLILRHPQILEYSIERTMQPRVDYFSSLNINPPELGRVISLAPALLQCSVETALKPRVRYLQEIVGVKNEDVAKVVQRSPQILAQSIEKSLSPRVHFLRSEVGISFKELAIMVTRHPQLLHYSVDEGMRPRIEFLLNIGVSKNHIGKVLTRLTQILSLSVENSLQPKYDYLVNELGGDVYTITSFPAYFSLSLELRIKPRHLYLNSIRKGREGPFPMKLLALTDFDFCKHIGCPSLEHYHRFRDELLKEGKIERN